MNITGLRKSNSTSKDDTDESMSYLARVSFAGSKGHENTVEIFLRPDFIKGRWREVSSVVVILRKKMHEGEQFVQVLTSDCEIGWMLCNYYCFEYL